MRENISGESGLHSKAIFETESCKWYYFFENANSIWGILQM